jgi:serine/threonine protein kinase
LPFTPGTRVGVYEITAQIGEGGMGEVYRATDSNLKRSVAIKVLPASVAGDADRLARFQREAEVLAALNHPNIAAIYGLEKTAGLTALVMELVEGEDLSRRIARGPIPIDEALPIAKQIAEALEAAHEQGIIHRDLKPANIKVRADGTVKVLDFGLAKAMSAVDPSGAHADLSTSPTSTSPAMTARGLILGTAAYMSPEQARGRVVDKRADIWAFGVVLYEMLTGRRAFEGEDVSDLLVAVLSKDVNLQALPAGTPTRLLALIRDCLVRDPKQRLRDIGDARLVLDKIIAGAPDDAIVVTAAPAAAPSWSRAVPWTIASVLAVVAVAMLLLWAPWRSAPMAPETRVDIVTPPTTQPVSFALSPDGRQIAYVASDDKASRLWLRSLSATTAQPLAGTEGSSYPFWSPDSHSIGFFAGGALKRLDLGGGAPQTLAPASNGSGGTWNANGVIVFAPNITGPLMRVSITGGAATPVTTLGPLQSGHFHPQFLPDGRRLLFMVGGTTEISGIYLGALDGGSPTLLVPSASSGVYTPAGWLLWVRTGTLTAQRLDLDRASLTGEPLPVADGMAESVGFRSAVSVAGTAVAYRTSGAGRRQLTWFDRSGTARGVVGEPGTWMQPRVAPDGRRVVAARVVQDNWDLWLVDDSRASRFTFDPAQDALPVWSPDGTRIVYMSRRAGTGSLFHKLTSGAGVEEKFLSTDQLLNPTSWSSDGRFLMYMSADPKTNADLWVVPMTEEQRKPFVFLRTPFREAYGTFSPDGRWVAYHSNESGQPEIYVRPFVPPGTTGTTAGAVAGQWQVSAAGGIVPMWRSDGKELYYINPEGAMMAASIGVHGATLELGAPVRLFQTRIVGGGADVQVGRQYDVTADGRFLINTLLNEAATPITLLMNWHPEAKK